MDSDVSERVFDHLAQRVVFSYIRSLSEYTPVIPQGLPPEQAAGQLDLHSFFHALYQALYAQPDLFGLPLGPDMPVDADGPERGKQLTAANRALDVPRKRINQGLDFLRAAALSGEVQDHCLTLSLSEYNRLVKETKIGRKFLQGLQSVGLTITQSGEQVILSSDRFPAMLLPLQALASACSSYQPENLGRFHFARCDFRALESGYQPQALDLYSVFPPQEREQLAALHEYLIGLNFKPIYQIYGIFAWEVKYQGSRKIKATPLVQVEYQERMKNPLHLQVKCASVNRIANLIPRQSHQLQTDFFQRAYRCNGAACNWCKNRKNLGPTELVVEDTPHILCWYVNPDVRNLSDESLDLIKQYVQMHEQLLEVH
jgi:hypothetical protein